MGFIMSTTDYSEFLSQFGGKLVNPSDDRSTSTPSDALHAANLLPSSLPSTRNFNLIPRVSN